MHINKSVFVCERLRHTLKIYMPSGIAACHTWPWCASAEVEHLPFPCSFAFYLVFLLFHPHCSSASCVCYFSFNASLHSIWRKKKKTCVLEVKNVYAVCLSLLSGMRTRWHQFDLNARCSGACNYCTTELARGKGMKKMLLRYLFRFVSLSFSP